MPEAVGYLRRGKRRHRQALAWPVPMATRPIAYMRDLTRSGIPDYFCLSYAALPAQRAVGSQELREEKGLQSDMRAVPMRDGETLAQAVVRIVDEHVADGGAVSMQMLGTRDALVGMEARGELEGFVERLKGDRF